MGICRYLRHTGCSVANLIKITGVSQTALYRWRSEEIKYGRVINIDSHGIRKLVQGTNGIITADGLLGLRVRRRSGRAA